MHYQAVAILAATGLMAALLFGQPIVALAGFALASLGMAALFPSLLSLASLCRELPRAGSIASVAMMGYVSMLAGPPLLGFLV